MHTERVHLGLALPQYGIDRDPGGPPLFEALLNVARRAEGLGLDGVWLSDHPFAEAPDGTVSGALEPLVVAAALARRTTTIRIGTLVLAGTMRRPALVAHSVRRIAPGRLVVGVGAGWYEREHRAYGLALPPYADRISKLEETLQALRDLGAGRPAILAGGTGERLLDAAARHADVWNVSWDVPVDGFRALSRGLDEACERAGRDPASIRRSVGLTVLVGSTTRDLDAAVGRLRARAAFLSGVDREALASSIVAGTPRECVDRIASYGADETVIALLLRDDPEMLDLFATEVAFALRGAGR